MPVDVREAVAVAEAVLAEEGLHGWRVVLDRAKTRAGVCRYARREISLSAPLTALHPREEVLDTILHEVAHAVVGAGHGHDAVWRAAARRLGCSGERLSSAPRPEGAWAGTCPAGHRTTRHRRPARVTACARCAPRFDAAHLLRWTHRGRPVEPADLGPGYAAEWERVRTPAAGPPVVAVGTLVRVGGAGPHAGTTGVVLKRGRTRYHLRTRRGVLTAPFALVDVVGVVR